MLRVSGPRALEAARSMLRPKSAGAAFLARRATWAEAFDGRTKIDEVVAIFYPGPNSATGEDLIEVTAHGSPYILKKLLLAALSAGARLALPGEFTQRAFLNGRLDLSQAEAVCDLIRSRTDGAHRAALAQLEGGLSRELARLRAPILELAVRVEAGLDHPEEDLPSLAAEEILSALAAPEDSIRRLAATFESGRILAEGARVCIVGRPNAGKSSLLNALLGTERAIVCPEPGTTRDTVEEPTDVEGNPCVLIDSAGLREESRDPAERLGMQRTERALSACDLALLVIDSSRPLGPEDRRVHERIISQAAREGRPVISILNKSDLKPRARGCRADLAVSATTRAGLNDLSRLIAARVLSSRLKPEAALVTCLRHHEALRSSAEELGQARQAVADNPGRWEDRVAAHLRESLRRLGEITGEGASDEVLRGIFSRFCVGK